MPLGPARALHGNLDPDAAAHCGLDAALEKYAEDPESFDDDLSGKGDIALQLDNKLQRSGPKKSANVASGVPYAGKGKKLPSTLKVSGPDSGDVNIKMTGTLKKRGLLNAAWKHRLSHLHFCVKPGHCAWVNKT